MHFGVCAPCFAKCFVAIFFVLVFMFHVLLCNASSSSNALLNSSMFSCLCLFFIFIYMFLFIHFFDGFCFLVMFIRNGNLHDEIVPQVHALVDLIVEQQSNGILDD